MKKSVEREENGKNNNILPPLQTNNEKCDEILPEHCEDLHLRAFTNNPADIFEEIRLLEDRYTYTISIMKEKMDKKVQDAQKEYGEKYRTGLETKKKSLLQKVADLKKEIEKAIIELNEQEKTIIQKIDEIYEAKAKSLFESALNAIDFAFK
jgi:hypothetical protein